MVESVEGVVRQVFSDLDHTLIDTAKLRERILALIGEWAEEYRAIEGQMINAGNFTMEEISRELARRHNVDADALWARHREILESVEIEGCVFPGVRELLAELRNQGYEIGIWSQGDPDWQRQKLVKSGLLEFVNPEMILIADNKRPLLDRVPEGSMIVDDSANNIALIRAQRPDINVLQVTQERGLTDFDVNQLLRFQEI